jgi:uncharacterized protein (TIGR00661 family)
MARVLYGVQGDAHGHAIRALIVARRFPEHEFLFVTYDHGAELLRREFEVFECPGPETVVRSHRLDAVRTLQSSLRFLRRERRSMDMVTRLAEKFKPDVAVTDYEYFVPRVCRRMELPCLSLDHQHVITSCFHPVPVRQLSSYMTTYLAVRLLFSAASKYIVTSFFRPPAKSSTLGVKLVPPFLRERVAQIEPGNGDHVVAYRSHPPSRLFFPFLRSLRRPVMVYGFNVDRIDGNLHLKKYSEEGFLEDLASCSYVICGGGHNLISEALFYGKPVMSFPIVNLFEQFLNAFYLEKLGYGRCRVGYSLNPEVISSFEAQLGKFRERIATGTFWGNQEVYSLLDHFIKNKQLPAAHGGC